MFALRAGGIQARNENPSGGACRVLGLGRDVLRSHSSLGHGTAAARSERLHRTRPLQSLLCLLFPPPARPRSPVLVTSAALGHHAAKPANYHPLYFLICCFSSSTFRRLRFSGISLRDSLALSSSPHLPLTLILQTSEKK